MVISVQNIKETCSRCGKHALITDTQTNEVFCTNCGFVLSERVNDGGPEWRSFPNDEVSRRRTGDGTPLARHDRGLSTIINQSNRDVSGKPLSASMKKTIERLRIWDSRSQSRPIDRNFRQAFSELSRLKDKLTLSDSVVEKAAYIYRKALEKKLVRGRSITTMIGSSLYAACREVETPRTLKDIALAMNIKKTDLAACYRKLIVELDLKIPVVDSVQNIARIASKIGISEKTKRHAVEILKKAEESKISAGKNPMSLAATALYISGHDTGETHTQRDLAEAANVTEVTIRNRSKGLLEMLKKV
ncbi:MAG TPA: TFIIB-type zinc ribbon-containing protein [Nitrosopumilaceae archaeon]|nr:TFIIB-type zinc ribbon-containing protein [Nitrosopumilaceae archaeon]